MTATCRRGGEHADAKDAAACNLTHELLELMVAGYRAQGVEVERDFLFVSAQTIAALITVDPTAYEDAIGDYVAAVAPAVKIGG